MNFNSISFFYEKIDMLLYIEDLILRKTELLEDIPTNIKEKKLVLLKIELDILYSKIKYDGKIRLFIFEIYVLILYVIKMKKKQSMIQNYQK